MCGRQPQGIGALVRTLEQNGIQELDFFKDLDSNVRNSFFHLDFQIKEKRIYCKNKTGKPFISIEELFWLIIFADRSSSALMSMCIFLIEKLKNINS